MPNWSEWKNVENNKIDTGANLQGYGALAFSVKGIERIIITPTSFYEGMNVYGCNTLNPTSQSPGYQLPLKPATDENNTATLLHSQMTQATFEVDVKDYDYVTIINYLYSSHSNFTVSS